MNPGYKFKGTIINFILKFKEFKKNMNKHSLNSKRITINAGWCPKTTKTQLSEVTKIAQYLKTELNKMIETLKRTLAKMKIELKNSISLKLRKKTL